MCPLSHMAGLESLLKLQTNPILKKKSSCRGTAAVVLKGKKCGQIREVRIFCFQIYPPAAVAMVLHILKLFCCISSENCHKISKASAEQEATQYPCCVLVSFSVSSYATGSPFQSLPDLQTPCTLTQQGKVLYFSLLWARLIALMWIRRTHPMCSMCTHKGSVIPSSSLLCIIISAFSHTVWEMNLQFNKYPQEHEMPFSELGGSYNPSSSSIQVTEPKKEELYIVLWQLSFQNIRLPFFSLLLFLDRLLKKCT